MGADQKSNLQKCGEILINIKAKNKKNKIYTFICTFCDANCDQLKKFSLHLEKEHLPQITEDIKDNPQIYLPVIKDEDLKEIETSDDLEKTAAGMSSYEDPLETNETVLANMETTEEVKEIEEVEIKEEELKEQDYKIDFDKDELLDYENYLADDNDVDLDFEDCFADDNDDDDDNDFSNNESSESEFEVNTKKTKTRKGKSSIDSEKNANETKCKKAGSRKPYKKRIRTDTNEAEERELCIALLNAFEKQTNLWVIKKRTIKNKINQQYFEIIAKEVNEKLNLNLTWEDAKVRIRTMRNQYTIEMQKKNDGEEYEIPWYAEHMKFLEENILFLMKTRKGFKKYRPLKAMDESQLAILIDAYKAYESLWQVNNIAHNAKRKRDEVFVKIVEDLQTKHNVIITIDELHRRVNYMFRIYSENKSLQFKCELEKRKFNPSTPLYEKMSYLSDTRGPFKCAQCGEIIEGFEAYHVHVAKHNDTIPFPCPLCKKSFHKYNSYMIHARRHMELNNHFCKFCGRGFAATTELMIHERSHTGEYPFLCQICGATFRTSFNYDSHVRRHENRFRHNCHICNHGFNFAHKLRDHIKAHLNIRDVICNICGKTFTSDRRLKNHSYIHAAEKRYKCPVCGKAFAQNAGLRQHRKQHQPFAAQYKKESSKLYDNI